MIHLITAENRHLYGGILKKMFCDRKKVFIDRLDWNLVSRNGEERDEFDTDDTIYLVVEDDKTNKIKSSLRLNPTTKPHLMSELFPHLCAEGVPTGETVWEISRYCYNPDYTRPADRARAFYEILAGVMETSVLYGWEKLTFVIGMALMPHCIRCGWDIMPIGLPVKDKGQSICAFEVDVNQRGLIAVRKNASLSLPSLKIMPSHGIAA